MIPARNPPQRQRPRIAASVADTGNSGRNGGFSRKPLSEKDRLVQQYNKLQQDIDTYENNIGFFSSSKNSAPLIQKMQERIDAAKQELKDLEAKIRKAEESEEEK